MTSNPSESDLYRVPLQGFIVECVSLLDAVAVKDADAILGGRETVVLRPAEIDRLAAVVARYGRKVAADMLIHRAGRLRAAALLSDSVGYEGPAVLNQH